MIYLRQSTASQEVPLGYFVDSTDGDTEETGLTIANTDIKLWKAGATTLANKNSGGATHISNGVYYAVLDATDTNTLGSLVIFVHVSGALAVKVDCVVLAANVYDSLIAGSDLLDVNTSQIGGTAQTGNDVGADVDAILTDTADMQPKLGTISDLGSGATLGANLADIEAQTDDIGAAGAGLSAVPWNAAWDAEVQSEVADALDAAIPGTPTAGSIFDVLKDLDALLPGSGTLSTLDAAAINAEVVDALATDTYAEPGSVPAATASLATKIGFLYILARNKMTQTATTTALRNDADSGNVGTSTVSDDGTTFTRGEWS